MHQTEIPGLEFSDIKKEVLLESSPVEKKMKSAA